jgi:hypothetical protein
LLAAKCAAILNNIKNYDLKYNMDGSAAWQLRRNLEKILKENYKDRCEAHYFMICIASIYKC